MRALDLDFAKRRRCASPFGLLLLVLGAAAVAAVAADYLAAAEELQLLEARQARLEQQTRQVRSQARYSGAARRLADAGDQARTGEQAAERAIEQLRLPWDRVLREIEALTPPAVALLSIESQGQTRVLRLTGEARTMGDAVAYVGRLRASPWIDAVYLSSHEERPADAVKVIRFSLDAAWHESS